MAGVLPSQLHKRLKDALSHASVPIKFSTLLSIIGQLFNVRRVALLETGEPTTYLVVIAADDYVLLIAVDAETGKTSRRTVLRWW